KTVSLDLSTVEPSLAGPKRPQDRVPLASMKENWHKSLSAPVTERGFGLAAGELGKKATVKQNSHSSEIGHGAVVIAAITSCTTCIGNSGPLPDSVAHAVTEGDLVAAAVLSGNRNFEGRVNPLVKANYLASPPLVVAYALAGTTDIDLINEPIGVGNGGEDVFLKDIWPTNKEVKQTLQQSVLPQM